MNKQLQLLENEIDQITVPQSPKKFSKRRLGRRDEENTVSEKPWKLSEVDRNQGLAGIAMIKKILASAPNTLEVGVDSDLAQAS